VVGVGVAKRKARPRPPDGLSKSQQRKWVLKERLKRFKGDYEFAHTCNLLYAGVLGAHKTHDKAPDEVAKLMAHIDKDMEKMTNSAPVWRAIQACLKFGNPQQQRQIVDRLKHKDQVVRMLEGKLAHKLVMKCYLYGSKEQKAHILKGLMAHPELFYSKYGATVWEYIYCMDLSSKQQRGMLYKLVLPRTIELSLPSVQDVPFAKLFDAIPPAERQLLMDSLAKVFERCVDKELLDKVIVHHLLRHFTVHASAEQLADYYERLEDGSPHLLESKEGTEMLVRMVGVATAKQRKKLVKSIKARGMAELATNQADYLLIARLLSIVDDTVLLNTTVLKDIFPSLSRVCFDKYGKKVILQVLCPLSPHYFNAHERLLLTADAPASVKDPLQRRKELLQALIPRLHDAILHPQPSTAAAAATTPEQAEEQKKHKARKEKGLRLLRGQDEHEHEKGKEEEEEAAAAAAAAGGDGGGGGGVPSLPSRSVDWLTHAHARDVLIEYLRLTRDAAVVRRMLDEMRQEASDNPHTDTIGDKVGHFTLVALLRLNASLKQRADHHQQEQHHETLFSPDTGIEAADTDAINDLLLGGESDHGGEESGSSGSFERAVWEVMVRRGVGRVLATRGVFVLIEMLRQTHLPPDLAHEIRRVVGRGALDEARAALDQRGESRKGLDLLGELIEENDGGDNKQQHKRKRHNDSSCSDEGRGKKHKLP